MSQIRLYLDESDKVRLAADVEADVADGLLAELNKLIGCFFNPVGAIAFGR